MGIVWPRTTTVIDFTGLQLDFVSRDWPMLASSVVRVKRNPVSLFPRFCKHAWNVACREEQNELRGFGSAQYCF